MSDNSRTLGLSTDAQEDLLDIWHFGANEWSSEQADRHLRDLDEMFERLRETPSLGHKRDELGAGLRSAFVRPHLIFYRYSSKQVDIIRILHQRSDTNMYFRQ
jgi:toxin ParE1/3/4